MTGCMCSLPMHALQESFFLLKYKRGENVFYCCGDEAEPRHVTAGLVLDYDTIAGADKFGNAFVLRLPTDVSSQVCLPPLWKPCT